MGMTLAGIGLGSLAGGMLAIVEDEEMASIPKYARAGALGGGLLGQVQDKMDSLKE